MLGSLPYLIIGYLLLVTTLAQSIGFTIYPQQVVTGLTYTLGWRSDGQPATIELLRNGKRVDRIFTSDGTTNTYQWTVKDDYDGGVDYAFQMTSGGTTVLASGIYVIEDEDGLVVSGSTLTTPSPTLRVNPAIATTLSTIPSAAATNAISSNSASTASSQSATSTLGLNPSATNRSFIRVNKGLDGGEIAGIAIGVLGLAAVGAVGVWLYLKRRRRQASTFDDGRHDSDSFLDLSKQVRASGTVKGTSPEVRNTRPDVHELNAGGIVGSSELEGESFTPWNNNDRKRFYPGATAVENHIDEPVRHELPAYDIR